MAALSGFSGTALEYTAGMKAGCEAAAGFLGQSHNSARLSVSKRGRTRFWSRKRHARQKRQARDTGNGKVS
jgi:hypothetical protein